MYKLMFVHMLIKMEFLRRRQFCQILIERNVMASGEGKFVSLAVRSREDNDKLLKVLSAL